MVNSGVRVCILTSVARHTLMVLSCEEE